MITHEFPMRFLPLKVHTHTLLHPFMLHVLSVTSFLIWTP